MFSFFRSAPFGIFSDIVPSVPNDGYILEGPEGVRRSSLVKDGELRSKLDDNLSTVHDLLSEAVRLAGDKPYMGSHTSPTAPYIWMTFKEVYERVCDFGSGILDVCSLKTDGSVCVGIYGRNCRDWVISEFACATYNMVGVPVYDTLGVGALKHICCHSELTVCICVTADRARNLLQIQPPQLQHIVIIEPNDELETLCKEAGSAVRIHAFEDIVVHGKANRQTPAPSEAKNNVLICYTSGTTGLPKGVIVTNQMLIATVTGCMLNTDLRLFTSQDVHLSYLPLAHIFEQFAQMLVLCTRGRTGFFSGDLNTLQQDAYSLQPTVFIAVPRVLSRIRTKVYRQVSSSKFKKSLLNTAVRQKLKDVDRQIYHQNTIWDQLVFAKVRKLFGSRVRVVITAGAPIAGELLQFIRAAFSCPVFEGYGSTEVCGAITSSICGDLGGGHVGPPLPNCEIKLCDIPELEIIASRDNKGEVCCKGPVCTPGYFKDPQLTQSIIDEDGWLHTGDVGTWIEGRRLKIVDRRKHIFKLSQGEYVAPEKIELIYQQSQFVSQVFVDGSTLRSYPVALVVPEPEPLIRALNARQQSCAMGAVCANGIDSKKNLAVTHSSQSNVVACGDSGAPQSSTSILPGQEKFRVHNKEVTLTDICLCPDANQIILNDLRQLGRAAELLGFEQVKAILLLPDPFTVENRMLTATMKCARHVIRNHYQNELTELFASDQLD